MLERRFIRHPTSIPITATAVDGTQRSDPLPAPACNIGAGGLSFLSEKEFDVGSIQHLRIQALHQPFDVDARVLWCRKVPEGVETGVEFLSWDEAYRARMVEQVCHIEAYRRQVLQDEGRKLDSNQAAMEWVRKFAAGFPPADTSNQTD